MTYDVQDVTETELKFCVAAEALPSLRQALLDRGARRLHLGARYFDTDSGALAQVRMALRLRREGRRWVQTLKGEGAGVAQRLEHEVAVPARGAQAPRIDPQRHAGTAAGQQLMAVLARQADATLHEQHATDIWRLHVELTDAGGTRIELALDIGRAMAQTDAGERSTDITELELEHKGGPLQGLFDLALACVHRGGLWLSTVTKAERGQRLRQSGATPHGKLPAIKARPSRVPAGADGAAMVRVWVQAALEQVLANASELQPGASPAHAADTVHQLRVGLRRLRVLLAELPALCPAFQPAWADALAHTFAQLGTQRDHVAVAAAVRPLLLAAGAPVLDWSPPSAVDPALAVREPAFQATLLELLALAHADASAFAALSHTQARAHIAQRLQALHKKLVRAAKRFETLPLADQHRVRRQLKRLRYLLEFSADMWPAGRMNALRPRLGAAQDALGMHQDVSVAADALRQESQQRPEAGFAAGYLQAHLAVTAHRSQVALRKLVKLPMPWVQAQNKGEKSATPGSTGRTGRTGRAGGKGPETADPTADTKPAQRRTQGRK